MTTNKPENAPDLLVAIALIGGFALSAALTVLGIIKFEYTLVGGGKFATFPSQFTQWTIGGIYLGLNILYLMWFFRPQQQAAFTDFLEPLKASGAFLAFAFLGYPLGNDVYLYLHSGLMNLAGVNPFLNRADSFVSELFPFVDWGQTSTYGPVSQVLFSLSALLVPLHPIVAVYGFKLVCLVLHIFNGYLVWRLVKPPHRDKLTIAYLLHPLLLFEQVSSAHVDILVSTCWLVLTWTLLSERFALAFLVLWGGLLSKTIPLVWMPLVGLLLLRQRRWWQIAVAIGLSLLLIANLSLTVFPTLSAWQSLLNPGVTGQYKASIHELARFGLDALRILKPGSLTIVRQRAILLTLTRGLLLTFAAFYAGLYLRRLLQSRYSTPRMMEDAGWVTLVLLLAATAWVMPWYASIGLAIAAVLPEARLFGVTALMFALSSSAQYLLQGYEGVGSLISVGIPVAILLAMVLEPWRLRSQPLVPAPAESGEGAA